MTLEEVGAILKRVEVKGASFSAYPHYIACNYSFTLLNGNAGVAMMRVYIGPSQLKDERHVVDVVTTLLCSWAMHEVREHFYFDGVRPYEPHPGATTDEPQIINQMLEIFERVGLCTPKWVP